MKQHLVLLTSNFPYGTGETFLENEIDFLCQGFQQVTIIALDKSNGSMRAVPNNCKVLSFDKKITSIDKLTSLTGVVSTYFWGEIKVIRKTYQKPLSKGILATLLVSLFQAKKIATFLKNSFTIDANTVLYSYWCDDAAIALAMLKKEYPRTKMLSRMHRWDIYFEESKVNYLPFRHFVASQLSLYSISEDGIHYAKKHWKVDATGFYLSRLGVENSLNKILSKSEVFTIVSCSNMIPVKRVHLIAEALHRITDISISWTHFGDGVLMEELTQKVKTLPPNIQVDLRGRIPNTAIYQAYLELRPHLFINVSSSEGVPVSIMEAMSCGIPVIATNVGGTSEIVSNENGHLLIEKPTPEEIAFQITRFLEMNENEYSKYSQNAYNTWKEKYNAEKNYREFVKMIQSL
jgi:glycosyltransferase involved in cell wall biosynthesis